MNRNKKRIVSFPERPKTYLGITSEVIGYHPIFELTDSQISGYTLVVFF